MRTGPARGHPQKEREGLGGGGDLGRTQINAAETMKESLSPLPRKAGQPTDEWTRTTGSTRNANWRRFITDARAAWGERRTDKYWRGEDHSKEISSLHLVFVGFERLPRTAVRGRQARR